MTVPTFLNVSNQNTISASVFQDMQLSCVFSEDVTNILSHPCDSHEIKKRQDFFKLLEREDFFENTCNFYAALKNLDKLKLAKTRCNNVISKHWIFKEEIKGFIDAYKALILLKGSPLSDEIIKYWEKQISLEEIDSIKNDLTEIDKLLNTFRTFDLSFSNPSRLSYDYKAPAFYDQIFDLGSSLGLKVESKQQSSIIPNETISNAILDLFAKEIDLLETYYGKYSNISIFISNFLGYQRQLKFFLEVNRFIKQHKIPYCYPLISDRMEFFAKEAYDVFLVSKNVHSIVPNDIFFTEEESFFFLLGANGGGKTTYLRTIGGNLILFLSGCPIFAKEAKIFCFGGVCSYFPKDECSLNRGRLDEELFTIEEKLNSQFNCFFLFNESFSSTDDQKGVILAIDIADKIKKQKNCGIFVTHFYSLEKSPIPILYAELNYDFQNTRTYKIIKSDMYVNSHAMDILKKYGMDYESLLKRRHLRWD